MSVGDKIWNKGYEAGKRAKIRKLQAKLKEKDELLFAYESVNAPINPLFVKNKQLREEVKRLKEALKRLNSGAAIYLPGIIPEKIRPEFRARSRFIDLVLDGKRIQEAEKQAYREVVDSTNQILDQPLKNFLVNLPILIFLEEN